MAYETPIGGYPRHDAYLPVECTIPCPGGARRVLVGKTRSVGAGGLEILLPESLPHGTHLIVRVREGEPVHGYVVWTNRGRPSQPENQVSHGVTFDRPVDPDLVLQWVYRANRQSHARALVQFGVEYHQEGERSQGTCLNLSRGGMFITTDRPTPTGSEVSLFFTLPGVSHPFSVLARVVWARGQETGPGSTTGMGVQFLDPKPSEAALIGAVVDRTCGDRPTA